MKLLIAGVLLAVQGTPLEQIQIVNETMPSGYRVVLAKMPAVQGREPRVYIGSYVLHGSMQDRHFGWAHLMEHVAANNRSTIPGPARPEGVNFFEGNALARPYYTSFVSVLPPALLASTIHTRMARAGRANNDSAVFVNEVGRVVAELERDMAWQYPAYKSLVALSRGVSPRLADEVDLIRKTDRTELAGVMGGLYRPDNAVLVIAGDIDLDSTRALVRATDARLRLSELKTGKPMSLTAPALRTNRAEVVDGQNKSAHHVVGVAWPKPSFGHRDQLPMLIVDQLLLGRGDSVADPVRSQASPIAVRLAKSLGGSKFWDGRAGRWQAPDMVDTGPQLMAILFNTDSSLTTTQVRSAVTTALREVRRAEMSDAEIEKARESLASFYERWYFEPTYRIVSDHLMVYAVTGRDPRDVLKIPAEIRQVRPADVRKAFDRYLTKATPNVVILPSDSLAKPTGK